MLSKTPLTLPKGRNRRGQTAASNIPPLGEARRGLAKTLTTSIKTRGN